MEIYAIIVYITEYDIVYTVISGYFKWNALMGKVKLTKPFD